MNTNVFFDLSFFLVLLLCAMQDLRCRFINRGVQYLLIGIAIAQIMQLHDYWNVFGLLFSVPVAVLYYFRKSVMGGADVRMLIAVSLFYGLVRLPSVMLPALLFHAELHSILRSKWNLEKDLSLRLRTPWGVSLVFAAAYQMTLLYAFK